MSGKRKTSTARKKSAAPIPFNLNDKVLVRLTDRGRAVLKAQHEELAKAFGLPDPYRPPLANADGWLEYQLWALMRDFGPHIGMGLDLPLETEIKFVPKGPRR